MIHRIGNDFRKSITLDAFDALSVAKNSPHHWSFTIQWTSESNNLTQFNQTGFVARQQSSLSLEIGADVYDLYITAENLNAGSAVMRRVHRPTLALFSLASKLIKTH